MAAKEPEAQARVRIDAMLRDKGYDLGDDVKFEGDIKNPRANQLLKKAKRPDGKRPDYHLYSKDSDMPLAFIEAKPEGGAKLDVALGEALKSARAAFGSKAPDVAVFASDGIQVKAVHGSGRPLVVNGVPLDDFPTPDLLKELVSGGGSADLGEEIMTSKDLLQLFGRASNQLRKDGLDVGIEQLSEFCSLLFLKIMNERGDKKAVRAWNAMLAVSGSNLLAEHRRVVADFQKKYKDVFSGSKIRTASALENILDDLNAHNFTVSELDIKGQAFEHFLTAYSAGDKSELGQFFTPRYVTRFMARLLDLRPGCRVLDPFCGTGGMLISSYKEIHNQLDPNDSKFGSRLGELQKRTLFGYDISSAVSSLAKMNMVIIGDGHSNIENVDALVKKDSRKFDHVITNIPFGLEQEKDTSKTLPYTKASGISNPDMNALCVIKCVEALKEGGSAAIIVPLTMCFMDKYIDLREYLKRTAVVRGCIRLPEKTFVSYTSAQTAILWIEDAHVKTTTEDIFYVHLTADGMSQDKKREPVAENHFPDFLESCLDGTEADHPEVLMFPSGTDKFAPSESPVASGSGYWKLSDLLTIKTKKETLKDGKFYAEPTIDSWHNTIRVRGNERLGKNIKTQKVIAQRGDLLIATLHTNNGNGGFAIADREYICESHMVATIKRDKKNEITMSYLVQALRRELPRQLVPSDLVGRETSTRAKILDVLIPKPKGTMKKLRELDDRYKKLQAEIKSTTREIAKRLPNI